MFNNNLEQNLTAELINAPNALLLTFLHKKHFEFDITFENFLKSEKKFFILKGFMGEGKSILLNDIYSKLDRNTLGLRFELNEITGLDDILLSFNNQFKNLFVKHSIPRLNIATSNFQERINFFAKHISKQLIIFIDSIDTLKNNPNNKRILAFLKNIVTNNNVKLFLAGRHYDLSWFEEKNTVKYQLKNFSPDEFKDFLKIHNQNTLGKIFEDFYDATQGHLLYLTIFLELSMIFSVPCETIFSEFERKKLNIDEFLVGKLLSLVPQTYTNLLNVLSICKTHISKQMCMSLGLLKKDELDYLQKIKLLYPNGDFYYLKDYIKQEIIEDFDEYLKLKIHKQLKNYYNSQLPLKPTERDLELSRETLRNLITYHGEFEKSIICKTVGQKNFNPMFNKYKYTNNETVQTENIEKIESYSQNNETDKSIDGVKLSTEEFEMLQNKDDDQAASLTEPSLNDEDYELSNKENIKEETSDELIKQGEKLESKFEYSLAIDAFNKSLNTCEENKKIYILTKIAQCQQKLGYVEETITTWEKVLKKYQKKNDVIKSAYILFNIAQIYKDNYKFEQAKKMYEQLLSINVALPKHLLAKTKLSLAGLEDSLGNYQATKKLCYEALNIAKMTDDTILQAETYFQYALCLDDEGNFNDAIENYLNCVNVLPLETENKFLSLAYTNIGAIYFEKNKMKEATKFYKKALLVDEKLNNSEGLYFIYTKLAGIFEYTEPEKVLTMYMKALFVAQQLKDIFYISSTHLDIGDYYYKKDKNELALRSYLYVRKFAKKENLSENIKKIDVRIKEVEFKMGKEKFRKYLELLKSNAKKK